MILITGATGTNGLELINQLGEAGEHVRVRALVRSPERAQQMMNPLEIDLSGGDLDDPASLDEAMRDVERLFLLCPVHPRQAELEANAVEAAKRAGVAHIVKFSVLHASLDAPAALLRWHAETEQLIRDSGIPYTFLRPNMFMQELLRQTSTIREQGTFFLPLGDMRMSLTDVRDIAAVAVKALTEPGHEGKTYEVTGPAALTFTEAAAELSSAAGRQVSYVPVPMEGWKQGFAATGAPQWMVEIIAELYGTFEGNNATLGEGVREATGKPARPFAEFAKDYAIRFSA